MKKIYSFLLLSTLLLLGAQSAWGDDMTFDGSSDVIYFKNITPGGWDSNVWVQGVENEHVFAYFFKDGGDSGFSEDAVLYSGTANTSGAIYKIVPPAGTFEKVILIRNSNQKTFDGKWNQTVDINLESGKIYLTWYRVSGDGDWWYWQVAPFILKGIDGDFEATTNVFDVNKQCVVSLDANEHVSFKVQTESTWYGWTNETTQNVYPNNPNTIISNTDAGAANGYMEATIAGAYTFTWDDATKTISVTYPTTLTRSTAAGSYGTICVPTDATIEGADLYTLTAVHTGVSVGEAAVTITKTGSNALVAGTPYIYKATSGTQTITLGSSSYASSPVAGTNGLTGVYSDGTIAEGKYFLSNNKIVKAGTGCTIAANRAYFDIDLAPASAPSAFRIVESESGATSIENLDAAVEAVKFIENGKLFIRKNGVVYDATGCVVR